MEELARSVSFSFWERVDADHTVVRFATSWATTDAQLDALASLL
jgi:threonine aldolase